MGLFAAEKVNPEVMRGYGSADNLTKLAGGALMPTVGHDAAMFQRRGIPSSVLLIRNANGSHNPKEHMEMADFEAGTKVLAATVARMCGA